MSEKKIVARLTAVGVIGNILLVAFKLYAGIAGHSGAMVSDAVHSLSDVFATFIAFIGVVLWAYSGKRKQQFDEAANLPFADDIPAKKRDEQDSGSN